MHVANDEYEHRPWYRQGWPWFIISIPAISVLLGLNMLYLAYQTNNSLVVDDYYKQGKSIRQYAIRDQLAAMLKLSAEIRGEDSGIRVQLSQADEIELPIRYPDALSLRWVHVTQASKDGGTLLRHFGGGRYFASMVSLPQSGKWRLHIEPLAEPMTSDEPSWRLVSDRVDADTGITVDYRT